MRVRICKIHQLLHIPLSYPTCLFTFLSFCQINISCYTCMSIINYNYSYSYTNNLHTFSVIHEFLLTMTDSEFGIAITIIYLYLSSSLIHSLSIEYRGVMTRLAQTLCQVMPQTAAQEALDMAQKLVQQQPQTGSRLEQMLLAAIQPHWTSCSNLAISFLHICSTGRAYNWS